MVELYNRDIKITAGPLTISPRTADGAEQPMLAIKFDITKTQDRSKNKAKLDIWNLTEDNRSKLQDKGTEVVIEAGYVESPVQIFKGDVKRASIGRTDVDWIVQLELLDGGSTAGKRINFSSRGGQPMGKVLEKAAEALGLPLGNLKEKVASNGARSVLKELLNSVVLSGSADDVVDQLAASMGLKYSVQDGKLQFLAKGEATKDPPVVLNASSGLIGSPSVGDKGSVSCESLLNGLIFPGRRVTLDSVVTSGTFICDKVKHSGATWGSAWTSKVELISL